MSSKENAWSCEEKHCQEPRKEYFKKTNVENWKDLFKPDTFFVNSLKQ